MKTKRPVRGFLCRPDASTAVCVPRNPRSLVVLPRTTSSTTRPLYTPLLHQSSRLVDPSMFSTVTAPEVLGQKKLAVVAGVPAVAAAKRERTKSVTLTDTATATIPSSNPKAVAKVPPTTPRPSTTTGGDVFQVVVMRVSLHCQGCAGKVKKHISKMEGVTSFTIDLETKRVTVMGHISPLSVLESISKVKRAEFWYS